MEWPWGIGIWGSLLTLTVLEIVLGIDNIVFLPCSRARCRKPSGPLPDNLACWPPWVPVFFF